MKIHRRFIIQFFTQLMLLFILLLFSVLIVLVIIGFYGMNNEIHKDLSQADKSFINNHIAYENGNLTFDEKLKELSHAQNGWLLALTMEGDILASYQTPKNFTTNLQLNNNVTILLTNDSKISYYKAWQLDDTKNNSFILLFGKINTAQVLLDDVLDEIRWESHTLILSNKTRQAIETVQASVQLFDSNGHLIDSFGNSHKQSIGETLLQLSKENNPNIAVYLDERTGNTVIVHTKDTLNTTLTTVEEKISSPLLIVLILLLVVLIIFSAWYANKFGSPILILMQWINHLGNGIYVQPHDIHEKSLLFTKNGKLKRKFTIYKELIDTLESLTQTLKQNERQRVRIKKTREEWISGLSHDLKTPLSAITGFTKMLQSDQYEWTEEEKKSFIQTISEKSNYMMTLIEDLTLTYRLQNDSLPMAKEKIEINEFLRRTIIHYINLQEYKNYNFEFLPYPTELIVPIDTKWFQRILDNLLMNAIKYNPPNTTITLSLSSIEKQLVIIHIIDDGIGMDDETLDKLFDRYYRGTNTTDSSSGSGLGMAITKQLVKLHEGSIQVKSTINEGTTIRIFLPLTENSVKNSN